MRWAALWCLLLAPLAAGCGERSVEIDPGPGPGPDGEVVMLLVADVWQCPTSRPFNEAQTVLLPGQTSGDRAEVVRVAFVESCTAGGGQYAVAASTVGSRRYWSGAAGCQVWADGPPPNGSYGVVRVQQTAGLIRVPSGSCVTFPGDDGEVVSDSFLRALAVFTEEGAARRFAATLGE